MRRRRARRLLAGAIVATLVGAVLALVPKPSLSVQRAMHADEDAPLLSTVAAANNAAADVGTVLAHRESVSEFRMIGMSWAGDVKHDVRVRTIHDGTWSAWTTLAATDSGPDPRSREARPTGRTVSEPLWVGKAEGYQIDVPSGLTALRVHLVRESGPQLRLKTTEPTAHAATMPAINGRGSWGARPP